ncbi:MAG: TonB-dependent receptor domain-containing protein, partial [Candidatus Binatia bacterium]
TVSASVYHYQIDDLIDQATVEMDEGSMLQFRNLGGARATGGEIAVRAPLPRSADAQASYAFSDARASGGSRLTNSPRHLGRIAASAPLLFDARGSAELVLVGPRLTLQRKKLSTTTLLNLAVTSGTGIPNLDFSAGLYNVLNQKYSDPGGSEHVQDRIPQDRFTYRVQLSYRF